MKKSVRRGFNFGLTSGIITTLGLVVGLGASSHSKLVVIAGILTIAIADSFSDALGIHISEEADKKSTQKQIWSATGSAYFSKLFFALTFLIPFAFLDLNTAIIVSIIYGVAAVGFLSYFIAKKRGTSPTKMVTEHLVIAILVVVLTNIVGNLINQTLIA